MRFCPNMKLLRQLPEFQRMKEYYADRHYNDHHLAIALQLFREAHSDKYADDWFPEDSSGKGVFTRFMNHELRRSKLSQTSATMQRDDISRLYSTLYSTYTPEVLANRIGMLSVDFRKEVDRLMSENRIGGRSRQDIIKAQSDGKHNGYVVIMNRIFNRYADRFESVEKMMDGYNRRHPDATEEEIADAKSKAEYVFREYQTILANKERLSALAAAPIGESEGFVVSVRDYRIDFEDVQDITSPMESGQRDDGTDAGESSKGDRYTDFRVLKLMSTLGPRARRLVSTIKKTDSKGDDIFDDLGRQQYLDSRQAAIALTKALVNSSPSTMMEDLRAAADGAPWMNGLIQQLEANPDQQTTIYCNFKKAAALYVYTNIEDGVYTPHIANSRSQGHALMRDAGSNLSAGYVLYEPTSVYVGYGSLASADKLKAIRKKFDELKDVVLPGTRNIRMVKGDARPKKTNFEYEKLEPSKAMSEFLRLNPDVPKRVSDFLRGLGYSITPEEIELISLQQMDKKGYSYVAGWDEAKSTTGRNKLYQLVSWMDAALSRAEEIWHQGNAPKTGQYFYNTVAEEFRHIDNCIALAKYNEVESRVNADGKSMSTFNNVNLLHQVFDILTNADHLSEEEYQKRLRDEYLRYEGMALNSGDEMRAVGWLKYLQANSYHQTRVREEMRITDMPTFNHVEYARMTRAQKLTNALVQFMKSSQMFSRGTQRFCAVEFPIQSDYSTAYNFCYAPKLSIDTFTDESRPVQEWNEPTELVDSDLVEALADEVLVELQRIAAIEERVKNDEKGDNRPVLSVYERQGLKFQIFPEFDSNGFRQAYKAYSDPQEARDYVKSQIVDQLEKVKQKDIQTLEESGILKNRYLRKLGFYTKDGKVASLSEDKQKQLNDWFFNTFYARLQMVKLWDGGLQNFNGLIDYEKRNMLLHATRTSLYTEATWNGKRVGKESQKVVYVEDEESKSAFYDDIIALLKTLLDEHVISEVQFNGMKKAYSKITSTDGQGFRTLESYRDVMIMTDQWDDRHEDAYQRIIAGKPLKGDIDVFMQNIKPVATGFEHIEAASGRLQKPIKLTFLHKYSEAVLLPVSLAKYCLSAQSVPLRALDIAKDELKSQGKTIDLFLFHSGAKVGAHSVIKPFAREKENLDKHIRTTTDEIKDYVVKTVSSKQWYIHDIPYKYYGIAASTPPHGVDDRIARASQKEKTVFANIRPGDKVIVNGTEMLATDARDLYYKIKSANIVEAYRKIREVFTDTDELERIFQEELANKSYQPQELKFALTHLANGDFALPMFSPNVSHQIQELLASIIKKRMTKIKTKGANILVTTAVGMEADVSPYEGNDGFPEAYKLGLEFEGEGKDKHLKWFDAGLPLPDALREFANRDGEITPEMLWGKDGTGETEGLVHDKVIPIEALLFDASRTPSDAEHSTVPCRIKWFSSRLEGSNMKVAKEAMVTTGQDFDGDKLRADFPEYDVVWDEDKLNEDFDSLLGMRDDTKLIRTILGQTEFPDFKSWRKWATSDANPQKNRYRKVKVVAYDASKSPLENSTRARHNMMIAITRGQLTSVEGSRRVLIPGGCEESKIYAKTLLLIRLAKDPVQTEEQKISGEKPRNIVKERLFETMTRDRDQGGLGMSASDARDALKSPESMWNKFVGELDNSDLTKLVRSVQSSDVPYTLTHSIDSFDYLMGGAEMIGIYALYNSAQQMLQRLDMHYVPTVTSDGYSIDISLFGHKIDKLFGVLNHKGNFSSLGLARLLNAAVDNGKDPILGYLNQTKEMAEMTSFLFAAGMDEGEVHLIMNQPAVIELINRMRGRDSEGMRREIDKLIEELQTQFGEKQIKFSKGIELVGKMKDGDYIAALPKSFQEVVNSQDVDLINQQTGILYALSHLSSAAKTLADFIRLTRPESDSGAIGSTISDITLKHIALMDFRDKLAKKSDSELHITGMRDVLASRDVHEGWDSEYIMTQIGDKLPEVVALNSLMMDTSLDMFKSFFPQARADWISIINRIFKMYRVRSKDAKKGIIETIAKDMILWKLLSDKKFVRGDINEEQKRMLVEVPYDLKVLKERIERAKQNPGSDPAAEALVGNAFLDKFTTTAPPDSNTNPRILFSLNGPAVEGMADSIRAYWGEMLNSEEEGIRKLAIDLFLYNMYNSGFGYGMYEFAHFAPFSVLMQTPGYLDALGNVLHASWNNGEDTEQFINYYIMNHWGDDKFLPRIPMSKLPNALRAPIGLPLVPQQMEAKMWSVPQNALYIVVTSDNPDDNTEILYRLDKDTSGNYHPVVATKLSTRLRGGQWTLHYNPSVDYREAKPVVPGNENSWGVRDAIDEDVYAESNYDADISNSTYTRGYVNSLGAIREGNIREQVGSGFAASLGLQVPTQADVQAMDKKEELAKNADKQNTELPPPPTADDMPLVPSDEELASATAGFLGLGGLNAGIDAAKLAAARIGSGTESGNGKLYSIARRSETDIIKERAIANGTFMLAPNGQPTKLTEQQWLQVRTKAFKDWFGDWENDPANASKVVDENGEPLVVYTGVPIKGITEFSLNAPNRASLTSTLKKGIYFSDRDTASLYTKGKPSYKTTEEVNASQAKKINDWYWGEGAFDDSAAEYIGLPIEVINKYIEDNTNEITGELDVVSIPNGEVIAAFLNIKNPVYANANGEVISHLSEKDIAAINSSEGAIIEHVDEHTRDDLRFTDSTDYIVFNPNQIKSATENNGEFSAEDDNIYLNIARRKPDGSLYVDKVGASPDNIAEARKQRVYVRLNERLRNILREKGVSVGVLSEIEARMSLAGVSDFDTAPVTAEGLIEMIRIANGYLGEQALPEEFAHLAIEMIGHDNALVRRLLDTINRSDDALREAFEGQYDDYARAYANDRDKLVLEAAGKLVAKQMFRQEEVRTSPIRRILQRVVDAIKQFLRGFRREEVQNAILDANDIASKLARELLGGQILDDRTLQDIKSNGKLFARVDNIKKDLTNKDDILNKILKTELKRLSIFRSRLGYDKEKEKNSASVQAVELQIKKLENSIENHKTEDAIIIYMQDSLDFLVKTQRSLQEAVDKDAGQSANVVCKKLNMVRDTLYGFSAVMDDVHSAIIDGEIVDSVQLTKAINDTAGALGKFYEYYNTIAMKYFEKMLSNVYGENGVTVNIGREKGRVITIHEMARRADRDISLASRFFHAIADCNDYTLSAIDDITRDAKYRARSKALDIKPRIERAVAELVKETGSRDQTFMFEMKRYDGGEWCDGKQDDGKLHKTGKYIDKKAYESLSSAQKRFYDTMLEIKKDADKYLPESIVRDGMIVMLRKYTWDRVKESDGIKQKAIEVWEGVRSSVMDTSDSIDYDNYEIKIDFEGNQVDMLPVYYLAKGKKESYDDMVDDVATSILAYAGMAYEYGELNSVIGILENAKHMASQRDIVQHAGSKTKQETIDTDRAFFRRAFTKKQSSSNIADALEDFFQMHIYGHIQANEGTIGNTRISKRKVVDTLNMITSYSQMAINIPQRIANITTGTTQILLETVGTNSISIKDVKKALAIYMGQSADRLAETGKTDYDNKLSLWLDKFDIHQDNGRRYKSMKYGKSRVGRAFNSSLLYAGLTMGEDLLASTTALAVAMNYKLKGPNNEDANLWDAYTVEYTDPANKTGAYLVLKPDYKKADGSELTFEDEQKFAKLVAGLNFELQGIYNLDDRSAVQQYALGSLLIMYRKWIAPSLKRRYAGVHYNALKGRHEEGYHRTLFRLLNDAVKDAKNQVTEEEGNKALLNIIDDMKALRTSIMINWNKMNEYERSNVKRSITELCTVIGLYLACALVGKIPPPEYEDDERGRIAKWWDQTVFSQMLRLRTEIGSQAPTPMLVDEAMHILKSPFAAIGPLQNAINSLQLLYVPNYFTEIKSGRYRGHSKAYKYFRELPIISMFKKVDNFLDPSPVIRYYQNDIS